MPVIPETEQETRELWRRRIRQAQAAQKPYWGAWATNLAFAAGQHYLAWDEKTSQLRSLRDLDRRYQGRELFTADRITERRQAQLGELSSEDDLPQLLAATDSDTAEDVTETLNEICGYAWEHEWQAEKAIGKADRLMLDVGFAAIRCCWNPDEGPVAGKMPVGPDGQALPPEALEALIQGGALPEGGLPQFKEVHEGRSEWKVYSPFQSLTPPGVVHEDDFGWECLVQPVSVDEVFDLYGVKLTEDTDIVSTIGVPAASTGQSGVRSENKLRDHCWLYLCYDRPSRRLPQGRSLVFGGPTLDLLHSENGLPYTLDRKPHTGIVYTHWWRLSDRFASRSFVEGMKDPQRIINRRKTQNVEVVDRSMPKLLVGEDVKDENLTGAPMEIVRVPQGGRFEAMQGSGPGQWMYQDIASLDEDLSHASSLSDLRLGNNPENVDTYGQLALLNDNEHGKRQTITAERRQAISTLVRLSLTDARRYWPEQKVAMVTDDDDKIRKVVFKKDQIPEDIRVKVPSGQPLPRSQGAEIKKIDAVWHAMVECGFAAADPVAGANWYRDSLEAGRALDLPKAEPTTQEQLARLENLLMREGEILEPGYYDNIMVHIPVHREEQDEARAEGDQELATRVEQHIQAHRDIAMANAQALAANAPAPEQPAAPGASPEAPLAPPVPPS